MTLSEQKQKIAEWLAVLPKDVVAARTRAIETTEMGMDYFSGTSSDFLQQAWYDQVKYYAKQRAYLNGLDVYNIVPFFNFGASVFSSTPTITIPTTGAWGARGQIGEDDETEFTLTTSYYVMKDNTTGELAAVGKDDVVDGVIQAGFTRMDFTISNVNYGSGLILKKITLTGGESVTTRPKIGTLCKLRLKSDNSLVGFLKVTAEGLTTTTGWDPLTGSATACVPCTDAQFNALLGWTSGGSADDVNLSANIRGYSSTTDKFGKPFFPVGSSGDTPWKQLTTWSESYPATAFYTRADLRWTGATTTNYTTGASGSMYSSHAQAASAASDWQAGWFPDYFRPELNTFSTVTLPNSGVATIPVDDSSVQWRFVANRVERRDWTFYDDGQGTTWYDWGAWYTASCLYNDVASLMIEPIPTLTNSPFNGNSRWTFLDTIKTKIYTLGQQGFIYDPTQLAIDQQFWSDFTTWYNAMNTFSGQHGGFNPCTMPRPTYTFHTAIRSACSTFRTQVGTRRTNLQTTSSTYMTSVHTNLDSVVNKKYGILTLSNIFRLSIQSVYDTITEQQTLYNKLTDMET